MEEGSSWQHISSDAAAASRVAGARRPRFGVSKGPDARGRPGGRRELAPRVAACQPEQPNPDRALYDDALRPHRVGEIELAADGPQSLSLPLKKGNLPEHVTDLVIGGEVRHGSGGIRITSIDIVDGNGRSTRQLQQGEHYRIEFGYRLVAPQIANNLEMIIAISRDGVLDCMRAFNRELNLPHERPCGTIRYEINGLPLANGSFVLSALIAKRGYYETQVGRPYSLNENVYDVVSRALEFVVEESCPAYRGTIFKASGQWQVLSSNAVQYDLQGDATKAVSLELDPG